MSIIGRVADLEIRERQGNNIERVDSADTGGEKELSIFIIVADTVIRREKGELGVGKE